MDNHVHWYQIIADCQCQMSIYMYSCIIYMYCKLMHIIMNSFQNDVIPCKKKKKGTI